MQKFISVHFAIIMMDIIIKIMIYFKKYEYDKYIKINILLIILHNYLSYERFFIILLKNKEFYFEKSCCKQMILRRIFMGVVVTK